MENKLEFKDYTKKNFHNFKTELIFHTEYVIQKSFVIDNKLKETLFEYIKHHVNLLDAVFIFDQIELLYEFEEANYSHFASVNYNIELFKSVHDIILEYVKSNLHLTIYTDIKMLYNELFDSNELIIHNSKKRKEQVEELVYNKNYYDTLMNGNSSKILDEALNNIKNVDDLVAYLKDEMLPLLVKIGYEWELGNISVAKEHMGTAFVKNLVHEVINNLPKNKDIPNKKVVLFTIENEIHDLMLEMISLILKYCNFDVKFIGHSVPSDELVDFLIEANPDYIITSLTMTSNLPLFYNIIRKLMNCTYLDTKIIAGGYAIKAMDNPKKSLNIEHICTSIDEILEVFSLRDVNEMLKS